MPPRTIRRASRSYARLATQRRALTQCALVAKDDCAVRPIHNPCVANLWRQRVVCASIRRVIRNHTSRTTAPWSRAPFKISYRPCCKLRMSWRTCGCTTDNHNHNRNVQLMRLIWAALRVHERRPRIIGFGAHGLGQELQSLLHNNRLNIFGNTAQPWTNVMITLQQCHGVEHGSARAHPITANKLWPYLGNMLHDGVSPPMTNTNIPRAVVLEFAHASGHAWTLRTRARLTSAMSARSNLLRMRLHRANNLS